MSKPYPQLALLLMECQHEWLSPQGKLYHLMQDKEQFEGSVSNIEQVLRQARAIGLPVSLSGLHFQAGYPELISGKGGLRQAIPRVGTFQKDSWNSRYLPFLATHTERVCNTGPYGSQRLCRF